jgi:hypothetical protein
MKTMRKYNLGSPKRPQKTKTKTRSKGFKKYNIGPPAKVVVGAVPTPDTPRSKVWKKKREEAGYKQYEIQDYEPDEQDLEMMEERRKLGIPSPTSYTTFEETITPFMREALKKKPLTDIIEQVNEEAWKQKSDDTPNKNYPRSRRLLPPSPNRRTHTSRPKTRGRAYKSRRRGRI